MSDHGIEAYFKKNRIAHEGGLMGIDSAVFVAAEHIDRGINPDDVIKILREEHAQALDGSDTVEFEIVSMAQDIVCAYRDGGLWNGPTSFECLLVAN
jgi:hypothetical protein